MHAYTRLASASVATGMGRGHDPHDSSVQSQFWQAACTFWNTLVGEALLEIGTVLAG